jgi:hypothetical protein
VSTRTRTHVSVEFADPFLVCAECAQPVPEWHDPGQCGCGDEGWQNLPCGHQADIVGTCPTWGPGGGCECPDGSASHRCPAGARR